MILQPLVENAVKHGFAAKVDGGSIYLRSRTADHRLVIEVEDDGGPWHGKAGDDSRPHGFDVVAAITGPGNWGINGDTGGRIAWATLSW